tara:strand:+ start:84 stop:419 length:336 start_codon:yes stop_codon:yes gene_type:complete
MKMFKWIRHRLSHKLENLKWSSIKKIFRENGLALVVIIVGWEIVEDVLFPIIFALLGNYVHPVFFTGIPVAWIVCLHWFMVPVLWGAWIKIKKSKKAEKLEYDCGSCDTSD